MTILGPLAGEPPAQECDEPILNDLRQKFEPLTSLLYGCDVDATITA